MDDDGRAIILKGTQMSGLQAANLAPAMTATTFSTIRLRWNMNALRLPVSVLLGLRDPAYLPRVATIVRQANRIGLVVILAASEDTGTSLPTPAVLEFWKQWAAAFKEDAMVIFDVFNQPRALQIPGHAHGAHSPSDWRFWRDGGIAKNGQRTVGMQQLVNVIRSAGASQVIAVMGFGDSPEFQGIPEAAFIDDPNIVYEVHPYYGTDAVDDDRDAHFGFLANRFPLLAGEWGMRFDQSGPDCRAVPDDEEEAAEMVNYTLDYFEEHRISWIASAFEPGKLIHDFDYYLPTEFKYGWTCGATTVPLAGMGETVQYYLWGAVEQGLIPVSAAGGIVTAPDSLVIAYGPGVAKTASISGRPPLPTTLAGIRIEIEDSQGAHHFAPLLYAGAGQANFLMPARVAPGRVQVVVSDGDGPRLKGQMYVQAVAPALLTAYQNARGPAIGMASQSGNRAEVPISGCRKAQCSTRPIRVDPDGSTTVRLAAAGMRHVSAASNVKVTIGGFAVPVVSISPQHEIPWNDEVTIRLPPQLRELGETDLILEADGVLANVVRISLQ